MSLNTSEDWEGDESGPRGFVIDIPTALVGIIRRSPFLLIAIVVGAYLGLQFGEKKGTQIFEATTILQYNDLSTNKVTTDVRTLVTTAKDQVKLRSNLLEVARRLDIKAPTDVLGKACEVDIQKNTTLMTITVKWESKTGATDIANTLRDVFLERQLAASQTIQAEAVRKLDIRLSGIRRRQKESDAALQKFVTSNDIIDIDKQSRALLDQYNSMTVLLEQSQADRKTIQQQANNIQKVIAQLKAAVNNEKSAKNAQIDSTGEVAARIDRLRAMISDDRQQRANGAELLQRKEEVSRYERLYDKGIVSKAVLDRARTDLEKQRAITEDTSQIQQWRQELEQLQKKIRPDNPDSSMSSTLLQGMLSRTFEIQLQSVAVDEKVRYLSGVRDKVKEQIKKIPVQQRQYLALTRNTSALSLERDAIQEKIGAAKEALQTQTSGFAIVSPAIVQDKPVESNRMMYTLAVAVGIVLIAFLIVVGLELLDTRIKSPAEVTLRLGLPLLAAIPRERNIADKLMITVANSRKRKRDPLIEQFSLLARRIRQVLPQDSSARLLMVSASHGEGTTVVMTGLAASLARQEETVLLMDAQTHPRSPSRSLSDLIDNVSDDMPGLAEYLSSGADEPDNYILPTRLTGVRCLPLLREHEISPDILGSKRMGILMEEVARRYSIVLMEAAPLLEHPDAEMLAQKVDAAVLVVRSFHKRASVLQDAVDQLRSAGVPVLGVVLTHVDRWYAWRR